MYYEIQADQAVYGKTDKKIETFRLDPYIL